MRRFFWLLLFGALAGCIFTRPGTPSDDGTNNATTNATPNNDTSGDAGNNSDTTPPNAATNNESNNATVNVATNNTTSQSNNVQCSPAEEAFLSACENSSYPMCGAPPDGFTCPGPETCGSCDGRCIGNACLRTPTYIETQILAREFTQGTGFVAVADPMGGLSQQGVVEIKIRNDPWQPVMGSAGPLGGSLIGAGLAGAGASLAVGAPGGSVTPTEQEGIVYFFGIDDDGTYRLHNDLTAADVASRYPDVGDVSAAHFGTAIVGAASTEAEDFVIGAPGIDSIVQVRRPVGDPAADFELMGVLPPPGAGQADDVDGTRFGEALALSETSLVLAIAAPDGDRVHIFNLSPDEPEQFTVSPAEDARGWESSVAIALNPAGTVLAVGEPEHKELHVFTFSNDSWELRDFQARRSASARFGQSVGVVPPFIFVGAPQPASAGAVHVFAHLDDDLIEIAAAPGTAFGMEDLGHNITTSLRNVAMGGANRVLLTGVPE